MSVLMRWLTPVWTRPWGEIELWPFLPERAGKPLNHPIKHQHIDFLIDGNIALLVVQHQ
jgi:hypothetical protein